MPEEDEYVTGEFYSRDELRRGFDAIVEEFALIDDEDIPDA